MSKYKTHPGAQSVGDELRSIGSALNAGGATIASATTARIVAGLESAEVAATHKTTHQSIETALRQALGGGELPSAGLEAAAILAAATAAPQVYHNASRSASNPNPKLAMFDTLGAGAAGSPNVASGLESFDAQNVTKFTTQSIHYTINALRQDALGELFYPTVVGTVEDAFFKASVSRPTIFRGVTHSRDGVPVTFEKYNLLDALRDATLLKNDATKLVPYASTEALASGNLAPDGTIATKDVLINGYAVPSRPLVMGRSISLIGISMHPELVAAGLCNQTDHVDRGARLDTVFVKVTKAGSAEVEYLQFPLKGLPTSHFYKTQEAKGYDAMLKTLVRSARITKDTKLADGSASVLLADFVTANLVVDLEGVIDGELNFEQSKINVRGTNLTPRKIYDVSSGDAIELATHASLTDIKFEPVFYTIDANLTNANRRVRGPLLDNDLWEEIYTIPLLPPFSVQKPINVTDPAAIAEIENDTLVKTTHLMISNSAVTTLLNYCEHLKAFYNKNLPNLRAASIEGEGIEGIGRLLITPYYFEDEIDLDVVVANLNAANKMADLRGFFTAYITELGTRMAQQSGYIPVLRQWKNDPEALPTLLVGTDQVLPMFMMLQGEPRVAGPSLQMEIASSPDSRMEGEIILSFGNVEKELFCPLNSGNMIWIPEWLSTIQVNRGGATVEETSAQPRFRHINNLPCFARIRVLNLHKYAGGKSSILFHQV